MSVCDKIEVDRDYMIVDIVGKGSIFGLRAYAGVFRRGFEIVVCEFAECGVVEDVVS